MVFLLNVDNCILEFRFRIPMFVRKLHKNDCHCVTLVNGQLILFNVMFSIYLLDPICDNVEVNGKMTGLMT